MVSESELIAPTRIWAVATSGPDRKIVELRLSEYEATQRAMTLTATEPKATGVRYSAVRGHFLVD